MTYEAVLRSRGYKNEQERLQCPPWLLFCAGGMAGLANWALVFPIDVIKSRYQTDPLAAPRYRSVWSCLQQTVQEGRASHPLRPAVGVIRLFFRGYSACLARGFLANAMTWAGVELVKRGAPA
jgi:hypothetical protein